jgi:biopolymer transport protein ExbD
MMVQRGISVELASSQSSGEVRGTEFIVVSVDKSGKYFLNKKAVSEKELSAFLIKMKTSAEKNTVIVSADKEAYHGQVIKLLDIVRRSGVKTAVFSVRQENVDI